MKLEKPAGFDWCPLPIWQAYKQQKGFGRFSHKLISRIINAPHRELITKIMTDVRANYALDWLFDSKTKDGIDLEDAIFSVMHITTYPVDAFISRTNWPAIEKDFSKIKKLTTKLRNSIKELDKNALQTKADSLTNFSKTGRFIEIKKLLTPLDAYCELLIEILEQPAPEPGDIQPRKINASRSSATTKARLLKRDCPKYYTNLTYQAIADLITIAENLDDPFTADDVRKA